MKSPAILFYTSDFLIGTTFMSNEEVGKYIKLLCMQHQQGHISEEDFYKICSKQDIKVIEKFKLDKNNKYFNKRMDEEIDKRLNYSKSRSSNRKANPNKTKEKQDNHMNNICKSYEKHMENENININDNDNTNKEKEIVKRKNHLEDYNEIIDYLNLKTNSSYKSTTPKTRELIKARYNEGFTLDDFKQVIDNKVSSWGSDEKMVTYLRPETLFSNKFEGYLNEKVAIRKLDPIDQVYMEMKGKNKL